MGGVVGKNTVICSKKPSRQPSVNKAEPYQGRKNQGKSGKNLIAKMERV